MKLKKPGNKYYESIQKGLGDPLLEDIENCLSLLDKNHLLFQEKRRQFRQSLLNKFPYLVIFYLKRDTVIIYRFINARKHPVKRFT